MADTDTTEAPDFLVAYPDGDGRFFVRVPCACVEWFDTLPEAEAFIAKTLHTPVADAEPGA